MTRTGGNPVVHLELQTANLARACLFYSRLFGWRTERIAIDRARYLALELGDGIGGGIVERETERSVWLPYVEVASAAEAVECARLLGASVVLEPREGPAGWRGIVEPPAGGRIAVWQPKR